ncbi:MAG: tetratricopeptide repeat protein [Burkholderiales bacterium]
MLKAVFGNWTRALCCAMLSGLAAGQAAGGAGVQDAARRAVVAQEAGDWHSAAAEWAAAHAALEPGERESPRAAAITYELGRALGVICRFEQSEQRLLEALAIDEKTGGPAAMSLVELARLQLGSGHPRRALPWFERAVRALDAQDAASRDAEAYAGFLAEYAQAAGKSGDATRAGVLRQRIEALQARHTHAHGHAERTPYGLHCAGSRSQMPASKVAGKGAAPVFEKGYFRHA